MGSMSINAQIENIEVRFHPVPYVFIVKLGERFPENSQLSAAAISKIVKARMNQIGIASLPPDPRPQNL
jgi:hypothetical protein